MRTILLPTPAILSKGSVRAIFPTGLYCLKEAVRPLGYEVEILDLSDWDGVQDFPSLEDLGEAMLGTVDPLNYDLAGFSTLSGTFPLSVYLAERFKARNPLARVVMGGPHVSAVAEQALASFDFLDAVVVGEGEVTFSEMLRYFQGAPKSWSWVPGILTRHGPFTPRALIKNLDSLPIIEYPHERKLFFKGDRGDLNEIEGVRGCFARCRFCSATQFWQNKVRRKSAHRLIEEMALLERVTSIRGAHILGDNFSTPISQFRNFCRQLIRRGSQLEWKCSLRLGELRPQDLALMKEANCTGVFVGLESASQETLDRINKRIDLKYALAMIREATALDLSIIASHIIGFPWEDKQDVYNTLRQHTGLLKAGVRSIVNPLYPLPGALGFLEANVVLDYDQVKDHLRRTFQGDYCKRLFTKYPEMFLQFGYYENPRMDRAFIMDVIETSHSISAILQ